MCFIAKGYHYANLKDENGIFYESVFLVNKGTEVCIRSNSCEEEEDKLVELEVLYSKIKTIFLIPRDCFEMMYKIKE
jgi:hypothetical protein